MLNIFTQQDKFNIFTTVDGTKETLMESLEETIVVDVDADIDDVLDKSSSSSSQDDWPYREIIAIAGCCIIENI